MATSCYIYSGEKEELKEITVKDLMEELKKYDENSIVAVTSGYDENGYDFACLTVDYCPIIEQA